MTGNAHRPEHGMTDDAIPEPSPREFHDLRALVHETAGIYLNDTKKALLHSRLVRRVRDLGLSSFAEYYRRACDDASELTHMLDRITTNETHFFREPQHFDFLERVYFPALVASASSGQRARRLRVWSAGCSTGEEPYSLAMCMREHLTAPGFTFDILATDLSTRVIDAARSATWPATRSSEIPPLLLRKHVLRGIGAKTGFIRASAELRALVRVERLNLATDAFPRERFDLIFCRNVLIYFHPEGRRRALERLVDRLAPGGLLFVGHAESVQGFSEQLRCVSPTIYARREQAPDARRSS